MSKRDAKAEAARLMTRSDAAWGEGNRTLAVALIEMANALCCEHGIRTELGSRGRWVAKAA